jgi:hypothetical protein
VETATRGTIGPGQPRPSQCALPATRGAPRRHQMGAGDLWLPGGAARHRGSALHRPARATLLRRFRGTLALRRPGRCALHAVFSLTTSARSWPEPSGLCPPAALTPESPARMSGARSRVCPCLAHPGRGAQRSDKAPLVVDADRAVRLRVEESVRVSEHGGPVGIRVVVVGDPDVDEPGCADAGWL